MAKKSRTEELQKVRPECQLVNSYDNLLSKKWEFKCTKCEFTFHAKVNDLKKGRIYCNCSKFRRKTYQELCERVTNITPRYIISNKEEKKTTDKWIIYCKVCEDFFTADYGGISRGHLCCNCQQSRQFGAGYYKPKIEGIFKGNKSFTLVSKCSIINNKLEVIEYKCNKHDNIISKRLDKLLHYGPTCALCGRRGLYSDTTIERNIHKNLYLPAYIYFVKISDGIYKIGITSNVKRRMAELNTSSDSLQVEYVKFSNIYSCFKVEQFILNKYKKQTACTDRFPGWTECFNASYSEVNEIINLIEFNCMEV